MIIRMRELFDIDGEVKEIDCTVSDEKLLEYSDYSFDGPIAIKGKIENRAGVVTLSYGVDFAMNLVCDRCLDEFRREYKFDFEHTLVRKTNTDNDEYLVCENDMLDLDNIAVSDLLLQLPTKILCKDDCKGLCCVCGQNLNKGTCKCAQEQMQ